MARVVEGFSANSSLETSSWHYLSIKSLLRGRKPEETAHDLTKPSKSAIHPKAVSR